MRAAERGAGDVCGLGRQAGDICDDGGPGPEPGSGNDLRQVRRKLFAGLAERDAETIQRFHKGTISSSRESGTRTSIGLSASPAK